MTDLKPLEPLEPKKDYSASNRQKFWGVILGVFVLVMLLGWAGGDDDESSAASQSTYTTSGGPSPSFEEFEDGDGSTSDLATEASGLAAEGGDLFELAGVYAEAGDAVRTCSTIDEVGPKIDRLSEIVDIFQDRGVATTALEESEADVLSSYRKMRGLCSEMGL